MYVMLQSLFKNNEGLSFNIFVFYKTLSEDSKAELSQLVRTYNSELFWVPVSQEKTGSYHTSHHVTDATYYRIYAPQYLPQTVDSILFLDADIVIRKSIMPLLSIDMGEVPLMAVKEAVTYEIGRLGIPGGYDYFNCGVLLINVAEWRKRNYSELLANNIAIAGDKYLMFDQDALNEVFYDKVTYIGPEWNHQTAFYHIDRTSLERRYGGDGGVILNDPAIIHFTTWNKPWHYLCAHPFKGLFIKYLEETPYSHFAQKATPTLWLRKNMLRVKHKLDKIRAAKS